MLSGGQKQRISIARALIKKPALLLFDDCLSAVDVQTEQKIAAYLDGALADKTAIFVTHRVYSHLRIDKVVVLEEGRIVEEGSPEELIANGGFYAELVKKQREVSSNSWFGFFLNLFIFVTVPNQLLTEKTNYCGLREQWQENGEYLQ